tara:strand:- start:1422 stop:3380 length:1959 start_codon:yes stop_codon:yes gene_type:complete
MAQYAKMAAPRSRGRRREYIYTEKEVRIASYTIGLAFLFALTTMVFTGVVALAFAPRADVDFAGLGDDSTCLRVARRADYAIVYMDVGSPMQRVRLLLDLETAVAPGGEALSIFSSRLHKSSSMACNDLSPHRQYAQLCHDLALVAPNGTTSDQRLVHTTFVFENDQAAYAEAQPASLAGLDGTFRLTRGRTYWLSTTHLCFAPVRPTLTDSPILLFDVDAQDKLRTRMIDLDVFDPELSFDDRCTSAMGKADSLVRLFPIEAANEASVWLTLSGTFLYEYGSDVLEKRRRVVEAGENCSALIEELAHQHDIYHSDCGLGLGRCEVLPSVPFRRLATRRIRIDVPLDGEGTLTAEHAASLRNVKQAYSDALASASARLLVLLLTAAVVFVRGSQNATSSRWLLTNVIDTLRCRHAYSDDLTPQNAITRYDTADIITDAVISVAAWGSRLVVLVFAARTFSADGQGVALRFQILGLVCSFVHFFLRYCLDLNWKRDAPITTLGGPMSVIDVTSAVLMLFSDAPLLGSDGENFASIGRLLIGLLISLSVGTRICFSTAMVATMAISATNGNRKELTCHKTMLLIASVLWIAQAVATSGALALLFVNPAAVALSRSQTGSTGVIKYAIYLGLVCTSLPTFTKVSLRVYQRECKEL